MARHHTLEWLAEVKGDPHLSYETIGVALHINSAGGRTISPRALSGARARLDDHHAVLRALRDLTDHGYLSEADVEW